MICDGDFAGPAACRCGHPERHVEITDEMVERAARAWEPSTFNDPKVPQVYRDDALESAREGLAAALGDKEKP